MSTAANKDTQSHIKFGTDGWRAVMADQFTFANLERVSQAYASHILKDGGASHTVSIGYDNRFLSEDFAARVGQVLLGNDIDVQLFSHAVPTPLLSFAVVNAKHAGGIMITASHNPPQFNGFKIKANWGGSAFEEETRAVESLVPDHSAVKLAGQAEVRPVDSAGIWKIYKDHVHRLLDIEAIKNSDLSVIVDSMHGTGSTCIEEFLQGGKAKVKVQTIRAHRDPLFGGVAPEPVDRNLALTKQTVLQQKATVAVVTDGDADRVGAVSEKGETMTMLEVVPILLKHLMKRGGKGKVVATVTQSVLLRRMAAANNLEYIETPVGFKYIAKEILEGGVLIGAEESGGIGVAGHIPERDGIYNSLLFLESLAVSGKKPTELIAEIHKEFGFFAYGRNDLRVTPEAGLSFLAELQRRAPDNIAGNKVVQMITMDGVKFALADDSWLMFRQSGTEPVLRCYAEGTSQEKAQQLLSEALVLLKKFQPAGV